MPLIEGSRNLYLSKRNSDILSRFSADELAILVEEGRGLFELTMANPTPQEHDYLRTHPKLMEVIEKW